MDDFESLLAELAPLAKAATAKSGDKADADKINKAAEEAGATIPGEDEGGEEGDEGDADAGDAGSDMDSTDGDDMSKSMKVTLPNGDVVEVLDAEPMLKALTVKVGALEELTKSLTTENAALKAGIKAADVTMSKALSVASTLTGIAKSQSATSVEHGDLLKSLRVDVDNLRNKPVGRRSVVTVAEKADTTPAAVQVDPAAAHETLMAKAMTAQKEGKLSSRDIARMDAYAARSLPMPPEIMAVLAA